MKLDKKSLTCVAAVAGAHGVHGNIKVKSFTEDPAAFASYGPLYDEDGALLFTPKNARPVSRFFSLAVKEKLTREDVEALRSTKLFVPRTAFSAPDADEFYYSDLVGMRVETVDGAVVGEVAAMHEFGAGDMIEIRPPEGPTFYHPFTLHDAPKVDLAQKRIVIAPLDMSDDEDEEDSEMDETLKADAPKAPDEAG